MLLMMIVMIQVIFNWTVRTCAVFPASVLGIFVAFVKFTPEKLAMSSQTEAGYEMAESL